jgi:hypothetical protein
MAHAEASTRLAAPAASVWKHIGPFASVGNWHPMIDEVKCENGRDGEVRTVLTTTGEEQVERLLEWNGAQRFYRYAMACGVLPVKDCVGELRVDDNGDGTSTIRWSSDFEVTDGHETGGASAVEAFLKAGLDNLGQWYERV